MVCFGGNGGNACNEGLTLAFQLDSNGLESFRSSSKDSSECSGVNSSYSIIFGGEFSKQTDFLDGELSLVEGPPRDLLL